MPKKKPMEDKKISSSFAKNLGVFKLLGISTWGDKGGFLVSDGSIDGLGDMGVTTLVSSVSLPGDNLSLWGGVKLSLPPLGCQYFLLRV